MGVKKPRINMAFTPENYEYIKVMSGVGQMDMTHFVNMLIERSMAANAEAYSVAKSLAEGGIKDGHN